MYTWENTGRLFSYQHPPLKNIRSSVLCFAFFTSNQIPFVLCTFLYLQNVLLEKHKHVTMRTLWSVSHTLNAAPWSSHLRFCFLPRGWAWAYRDSVLSLCLFFTNLGFSWKTGHYACVSLDHALAAWAQTKVVSNWVNLISGQESWPSWWCLTLSSGKPDVADRKPRLWLGHLEATRWLQRHTHKHTHRKKNPLSNSLQAVKSNAEHSGDWQPRH